MTPIRHSFSIIMMGLLMAMEGCGSDGGGQPRQTSLSKSGVVFISNAENTPAYRTLININYVPEPCVLPAHQGDCYAPPTCPNQSQVSAGAITLSGKTLLTVVPAQDNTYRTQLLPVVLADEGQTVQVDAAGGDVPAHSGTVTMPPKLMVTMPSGIDRTRDLPLQWMPGTDTVNVFLQVFSAGELSLLGSVACSFRDSAGAGTIPASFLQQLPSAATGTTAILSLTRYRYSTTSVGDWTVSLTGASSVEQMVAIP